MVPDARRDARIFSGLLKWVLMHRDVPYTSVELFWYSALQNLFFSLWRGPGKSSFSLGFIRFSG